MNNILGLSNSLDFNNGSVIKGEIEIDGSTLNMLNDAS